jgi:putative transposase
MHLAHKICLQPTFSQETYFWRAAGVARFSYNWALTEWNRQYAAGEKPSAAKLKAQWNAIRTEQFPWSKEVTKCASGDAIMNLGMAFNNFFRDLKKPTGRKARHPKFKKKGQRDSFALWNDQFVIDGDLIRMPHIGWVKMREALRFKGKIMGAVVSHEGDHWFVSVQMEMLDPRGMHPSPGTIVGIDAGITTLMTLSRPLPDGRTAIANPKARRAHMKRMKTLQRRISRQELRRRTLAAERSNRQSKRQAMLRKLHYRVACVRKDAIHKATTLISKHFETIVIENLNVSGMVKNHNLAGAIHDAAFAEQRRQLEYKAVINCGTVILADRFFASSKTCSACGNVMDRLPLKVREWSCPDCGAIHDRDFNAATNLEWVGQAMPEPLATATHGEMGALAGSSESVKLPSMNRELNPCEQVRTP